MASYPTTRDPDGDLGNVAVSEYHPTSDDERPLTVAWGVANFSDEAGEAHLGLPCLRAELRIVSR